MMARELIRHLVAAIESHGDDFRVLHHDDGDATDVETIEWFPASGAVPAHCVLSGSGRYYLADGTLGTITERLGLRPSP